jgi:enamine deaminase RidA (YjgF/YER057c/UK114 family)
VIRRISSGGPYEEVFGYSRAVVAGPFVIVSGSTSTADGAYDQAVEAFGVATRALAEAGASVGDVVRTRMFVTDIAHAADVGRAHREIFGGAPPAATMVAVSALVDPRMLVEVEVVAYREQMP